MTCAAEFRTSASIGNAELAELDDSLPGALPEPRREGASENARPLLTAADREHVRQAVIKARREGWEDWELPEIAAAALRQLGLPTDARHALALEASRG